MDRIILHSDINACYASVETLYDPSLRGKPMAVCGDKELRHGIVLSKDELAKTAGVKTGMAIWEAKRCCPELQIVRPHFERYERYSRLIQEIYLQYTDRCEPFGIDESWLDISGCGLDGGKAAEEIKSRVFNETGLTVSIGVSWNKILAKLGSDYKKPNAVTVIDREHFRSMVWPLPASSMLMVGRSTENSLRRIGIHTIGELAAAEPALLQRRFGKMGIMLHSYANGNDLSPVRRFDDRPEAKSIGNSATTARDMICERDVLITFHALAESVGARLRREGFKCHTVEIALRSTSLEWQSHRVRLSSACDCTQQLLETAMQLFGECRPRQIALRGVGLRALDLVSADAPEQLSLFSDYPRLERARKLDSVLDSICGKYGSRSIMRGIYLTDNELGALDASETRGFFPQRGAQ